MAKQFVSEANLKKAFSKFETEVKKEIEKKISAIKPSSVLTSIVGNIKTEDGILEKVNWIANSGKFNYSFYDSDVDSTDVIIAIFEDKDNEIISACSLSSENISYNGRINFVADTIPSRDLKFKYLVIPQVN